jgi:hypothetical protein
MDGLSCPRLLWCEINAPERIPPVDTATQAIFDQGHEVGNWAKKLYPKGVEIEFEGDAIGKTKAAVSKRVPVFEASFAYKNGYCKTDILVPVEKDEWDIVEVKSSTKVKDEHIEDVAFQRWVLEGAGLKIRKTHLMFLNNEYVRHGAINPKELFGSEDITEAVSSKLPEVEENLGSMISMLKGPEPKVELGVDCTDPFDCSICSTELDDADVTELYFFGKKAWPLVNQGIRHIKDLPKDFKLSDKQQIQVNAFISGKTHVDKVAIQSFLKKVKYPVWMLDFETLGAAVPLYDDTYPYQNLPFQFSVHMIAKRGAEPEHFEFLADGPQDPRPALVKALKVIGPKGTVLAFNAGFEKGVLEDLAATFKKDADWLHNIIARLDDLILPFRNFWYYHPEQHGSCSIKNVLPAMTGKSYDTLEVQEGTQAQREFMRITFTKVPDSEKKKVREALLKYCEQDTQAMIDVFNTLQDS